ncbi:hypothetical protein NSB24_01820 [Blautia coccoides]|uniref:hypothetical protein n=1 Tax=Blautia producta TaxID=33035 RepID=UPI00214A429D|nr:hypothetical protein [Blautia coccoides]MCR1984974.1 hypothetical protein [Blautia coccoides]
MREILYKAKGRDGEGWKEGYYWLTRDTTFCFCEDYEKNPDITHHYILFDQMSDWGLPNQKLQMDIIPETLCQFTGLYCRWGDGFGVHYERVWEHDLIEIVYDGKRITAEVRYDKGMFVLKSDKFADVSIPLNSYLIAEGSECINVVRQGNRFDNL